MIERIVAQAYHALRNGRFFQPGAIGKGVGADGFHTAVRGDHGGVAARHQRFAFRRDDAVPRGGIGGVALGHGQRFQGAPGERLGTDAADGLGDRDLGQTGAIPESSLPDARHGPGDRDGRQPCAAVKRTITDTAHVLRDRDRRQPGTTGQQTVAD